LDLHGWGLEMFEYEVWGVGYLSTFKLGILLNSLTTILFLQIVYQFLNWKAHQI
jgi:hypothetical protein